MDALRITGGVPLTGTVTVSGAKNAALPMMAAAILADGPVTLHRVPELVDVRTLARLLSRLGVTVRRDAAGAVHLENVDTTCVRADRRLVARMRASFCVLGPLLARRGRAVVAMPGGCAIGQRPVDLHLHGLAALGADIRLCKGYVIAEARRLRGATIHLAGPWGPTVTGTANVMSAATLARGTTIITGAAVEPEIVDLGQMLVSWGAQISGLGTSTIEIRGVDQLGGGHYRLIPDRIEAATLLCAAAITRGRVTLRDARADHMTAVLETLAAIGCTVDTSENEISLRAADRWQSLSITALPYPGIPTDVQSQFTALATLAPGRSRIEDRVFPERFQHVRELARLGASIRQAAGSAAVRGVERLTGATVTATDLRASAALVLAGLAADDETTVRRISHLDRGYERLEEKLRRLGAQLERVEPTTEACNDVSSRRRVVMPLGESYGIFAKSTAHATTKRIAISSTIDTNPPNTPTGVLPNSAPIAPPSDAGAIQTVASVIWEIMPPSDREEKPRRGRFNHCLVPHLQTVCCRACSSSSIVVVDAELVYAEVALSTRGHRLPNSSIFCSRQSRHTSGE